MSIIAGCFYGLNHLLTNFTHSVQEGIHCHCLIITILSILIIEKINKEPIGMVKIFSK